ncbi:MAG: hypothetical protein PWP31_1794 [Clostridia bacterium]|nr:hypothetical protein [Clostridia bacterium]
MLLLLSSLALITGSWIIVKQLKIKSITDSILAVGIISIAAKILILLTAGIIFTSLNRQTVLLLVIIWLAFSLILQRILQRLTSKQGYFGNFTNRKSWEQDKKFYLSTGLILFQNPITIIVGLVLFLSFYYIALGWIYLPPFAWDEIWYHLTPMAFWYKQEAISPLPEATLWHNYNPAQVDPSKLALDLSVAFNWSNVYPLNTELSALWIMVLTGKDLLVDAAQLPYVLVGSLATYGLSKSAGASRNTSLLTAMLFILTPMVLIQLRVAYADAAFASMVATSIYLFLRWQQQLSTKYALLLGLSLGLMMGIKSTGIAFAGILALLALFYLVWHYKTGKIKSRMLWQQTAIAFFALVLTGSYWYLRTWWYYGNPIYPVELNLFGLKMPGLGSVSQLFMTSNTPEAYQNRNVILNIFTSWLELGKETYNYYSRTRGLGPIWSSLALPAVLPFIIYAWRSHYTPPLWMVGIILLFLTIQPAVWWPRYILYIIPVGLAAFAWVYDHLQKKFKIFTSCLLILHLTVSTSLVLIETLDKLPLAMHLPAQSRTFGQLYFNDYIWVDKIPPSSIGHTPMAWIYPLYGGLRHEVYLIDGISELSWRKAILEKDVQYVVVTRNYGKYDSWAKSSDDLLDLYFKGDKINVYKVK